MSLSERVKWIEHKNVQILYSDFSNLNGQDMLYVFRTGKKIAIEYGKDILLASNFKGSKITSEYITDAKTSGVQLDKIIVKNAVIGMSGLQKIFFNGYNKFTRQSHKTKSFDTLDEALEWLSNS